MSGLLQRMILRARDPAAVAGTQIEPLLAPRYAPANSELREPRHEVIEDRPAAAMDTAASRGVFDSSAGTSHALRERRDRSRTAPEASRTVTPRAATPPFSETASRPATTRDIPESASRPTAPETVEVHAAAVIARPMLAVNLGPPRNSPAEALRASQPESTASPATPITGAAPVFPVTARTPDRSPTAMAPDITISIGHIELRSTAPRQAARRAEFRPRVSLDAFLGRESGAKR